MTISDTEAPRQPGAFKQISYPLWVALLFIPIEILFVFIILALFKIIPFPDWPEIWIGISYFSLLMALVLIILLCIPHQPGTFGQIPFAFWIPLLSIPAEVLLFFIIYIVGGYIYLMFDPKAANEFLGTLGIGYMGLWLVSAAAILVNIFALRKLWTHQSLPFYLATAIPYGIIILPNLFFFLVALFPWFSLLLRTWFP